MANPQFRRNVVIVTVLHFLVIAVIIYFAFREVKKPEGEIVWVAPSSFSQVSEPEIED